MPCGGLGRQIEEMSSVFTCLTDSGDVGCVQCHGEEQWRGGPHGEGDGGGDDCLQDL